MTWTTLHVLGFRLNLLTVSLVARRPPRWVTGWKRVFRGFVDDLFIVENLLILVDGMGLIALFLLGS
jgi:hypothetical protein